MSENNSLKIKTATGIFWQLFERIAAELVTLIVTIVLARFLMPSDYGTIALIEVFISIFSVFVTTGFGSALIQKKEADDVDFYSALYASIIVGIIIYILLFIFAPSIAKYYSNDMLIPIVRFMGLQIPILSVKSVETAFIAKNFLFKKFFFATLVGTIISGVIGIFLAYLGFGPWAICVQTVGNMFMDMVALAVLIKKPLKMIFSFERIKTLWGFTSRMLVSSVINAIYMNLKKLIIGKNYSSEDLSFYTKGEQFPKLIANNITTTIEAVFFPTLASEQENIQSVLNITRRFVQIATYLMFPLLIGLAAIGDTLIPLLLTDKWAPCVIYLQITCLVFIFNPIQTATIQPIKALGRADMYLKMELIKKIVGIVLLLLVMRMGVMAIASISLVLTLVNWVINAIPAMQLYNYKLIEQIMDFLPNLLLSFLMGGIVYFMNFLPCMAIVKVGLQICVGGGVYLALSMVTHNRSFYYVLDFIKEYLKKNK